jgi:hypothetical protein
MAGLDPAIHDFGDAFGVKWITGSSPVMTVGGDPVMMVFVGAGADGVLGLVENKPSFPRRRESRWMLP